MKRILCFLGIHKWRVIYKGAYNIYGDPLVHRTMRECKKCKKRQEFHKHLLGFNPVDYYDSWRTIN